MNKLNRIALLTFCLIASDHPLDAGPLAITNNCPQWTAPFTCVTNILAQQKAILDIPNGKVYWMCVAVTTATETNAIEWDNHSGCYTCDGIAKHGWAVLHDAHPNMGPYVAPTEKWTVSTVNEETTFKFNFRGNDIVWTDVRSLKSTTNHWKLESTWKEVK